MKTSDGKVDCEGRDGACDILLEVKRTHLKIKWE